MSGATKAGVCRFCGVTDVQVDGDKLCWMDKDRTCCNKYSCRKQYLAEQRRKAVKPAKPRSEFAGWGYGAIVKELQKRRRKTGRLRRKGKAA